MIHRRSRSRSGFTLVELAIVVALVGILSALGINAMAEQLPRWRTIQATRDFTNLVQECRALAIRSGRECSIWLLGADPAPDSLSSQGGEYWVGLGDRARDSTTWDYLPVDPAGDTNQSDGIVNLADTANNYYQRRVSIGEWRPLTGPGTGNGDRIVFDARGFVSNPGGDFSATGFIDITFINKDARHRGVTDDYIVRISRAGMTRVDATLNPVFETAVGGTASESSRE
jgi:prepilin-type N-terminal cleavage/methylation domain-containing protein